MRDYNTFIGQSFSRLHVIGTSKMNLTKGVSMFKCLCSCGQAFSVKAYDVVRGKTKSCGCLRKDVVSDRNRNKK